MEIKNIYHHIHASVVFTRKEVETLIHCSEHHYDYKCKELSKPGGLLFGMRNKLEIVSDGIRLELAEWTLGTDELNLLAKCAEYAQYLDDVDFMVHIKMVKILNRITDMQRKANGAIFNEA